MLERVAAGVHRFGCQRLGGGVPAEERDEGAIATGVGAVGLLRLLARGDLRGRCGQAGRIDDIAVARDWSAAPADWSSWAMHATVPGRGHVREWAFPDNAGRRPGWAAHPLPRLSCRRSGR